MTRSHFGSVQRLGKDRYRVWWTEGGERRSHVVRGTRDDAELYLAKAYGGGMAPDTTWSQLWKLKVAPELPDLSAHTRNDYERLWAKHLEPAIGDEPVREMDWDRANDVLTSIDAPSTQRYCGRLLRKMCYIAMRDKGKLLQSNPVFQIRYKKLVKRKKALVPPDGVHALMAELEGAKYEGLVLAMLGGGLRPEEADALLWEDVMPYEFKGSVYCKVSVYKAVTVVDGRKLLKGPKNDYSEREVVLGEPFASRLLELADGKSGPACPGKAPSGSEPNETWFTSPVTITHNFKDWCAVRGLPYTCQEHMRSSYATIAGEAMVPDSVVEGNMGHAGSTTKARNYQKVTMRAKCMAADMIAEYLEEFAPGCGGTVEEHDQDLHS